jgi:hypothetical protein
VVTAARAKSMKLQGAYLGILRGFKKTDPKRVKIKAIAKKDGVAAALAPYEVPWTLPLVFSRATMLATGQSYIGLKVGTWHMRYQVLRTFVNTSAAA